MIGMTLLGTNGRFGNQMFQYATLYALGQDLNFDIGVPYHNKNENEYFNFCLPDAFSLSAKDLKNHYFSSFYQEPHFHYDPNILNIPNNTNLKGYFQSEKYFKKYKTNLINKEFKFNTDITEKADKILNGRDCELISVHLRLGDYLKLQESHPICSADYYKMALDQLPKDANIVLFTDDYSLAIPFFKDLNISIFACGTNDKFVDMCLMSKCEYHVIANSSYSWWGAWLSNSKKTIAPKQWFGSSSTAPKNWSDIYSDEWLVI
jgi:hypothetical protein